MSIYIYIFVWIHNGLRWPSTSFNRLSSVGYTFVLESVYVEIHLNL